MFCKTIIFLFICYNVKAQDHDCNYYQEVIAPKTYHMQTPEYPHSYSPGRQCRFIGACPNRICMIDCQLEMPESPNCSGDHILISRSGDEKLIGADKYCGTRNLTGIVSYDGKIVVGLKASQNSRGGRFKCRLKSKNATNPAYCRCGEIKQTRIVGGNATGEHEYSMMAGIRDINTNDVICGASVLKNNWALSAAHCFFEDGRPRFPRDLRIIVGHRDTQQTISYQVRQYFTHPNYDSRSTSFDYDVALIQTITIMQLSSNVLPVCLPYALGTDNLVGYNVTVTGWGTTGPGRPTTNILRAVQLRVVSSNYCQQSYPEIDITSRRICTFASGKDSCQMDSGGPLLLSRGGSWFLVGLVSFGLDCAPSIPSVNTRVTPYLNWITKTIGHRGICVRSLNRG